MASASRCLTQRRVGRGGLGQRRPSVTARRLAASARRIASTLPSRGARAMTRPSARATPPAASRLARIRASSTTSALNVSAMAPAAPAVSVDQRRQRLPFGLPAARRALVLLRHRRQHRGDQARSAHRGGHRLHGADRIVLVRHRRRAAAALHRRVGDLGDFGLRQQRQVAANLAQRSAHEPQRAGDVGEAAALGVPGDLGDAQAEARGQRRATPPARPRRGSPGCRWRRQAAGHRPPGPRRRAGRGRAPSRRASWPPWRRTWSARPAAARCGRRSASPHGARRVPRPPPPPDRARDRCPPAPPAAAAPAPCRSRPGWSRPSARNRPPVRSCAATSRVRWRTSGITTLPATRSFGGEAVEVVARHLGGDADRRHALAGITSAAASASASATSTSSSAWTCPARVKGSGRGDMGRGSGAGATVRGRRTRSRRRPAR